MPRRLLTLVIRQLWGVHCPCLSTITRPPVTNANRLQTRASSNDFTSLSSPSASYFCYRKTPEWGFHLFAEPIVRADSADADANKGPKAVWSGRPTQGEEGGRQQKGALPLQLHKTLLFHLSYAH